MLYTSVLTHINTPTFMELLLNAIPEKHKTFSLNCMSTESSDDNVIMSELSLSSSDFRFSVTNTLLDHILNNDKPTSGLAKKIQVGNKITKINKEISMSLLHLQQREMSLDFFESLNKTSSQNTQAVFVQFNTKTIREAVDKISECLIYCSSQDTAIGYLRTIGSLYYSADTYQYPSSETQVLESTSECNQDASEIKILFDAHLLFNLLQKEEYKSKASPFIQLWLMKALIFCETDHRFQEYECLGTKTTFLGLILSISSLLYSLGSDDIMRSSGIKGLIENKLTFVPNFYEYNAEILTRYLSVHEQDN
jgi:hypothetical protein